MGHFISDQQRLWPAGHIPYEIDEACTRGEPGDRPEQESAAVLIRRAIDEWNHKTVLRLSPRTGEKDYVVFEPTQEVSQSEYVGCNGGRQSIFINLQRAQKLCAAVGGSALGVVVHEIGHAVGLLHEHQRSDRDDYITINWDNIDPSRFCGFCVRVQEAGCEQCELLPGRPVGPYDYDSVMHYFAIQGAIDPAQPAIVPVVARAPGRHRAARRIGRCDGLSAGDIATVAAAYTAPE